MGNDSVDSIVNPHSGYFPISTLAMPDSLAEGFEQDFIVYAPEDLPRDIFADDPRATFGVFFTKRHILIYSAGPDGVWQINPRLPVNKGSEDPMAELQPFALPPGAGQGGVGDIILILDRRTAEDSADCYSLRVQLHPSGE
ncbi:hypothetical protein HZA57_07765 [Candidatus Poribacteria bacterium]|nr:hypothetical protein [Candidatus Poribacteria bacterium]